MGTGVPVTIRWTEKEGKIPPCDFVNKRGQFIDEFKENKSEALEESQRIISDVTKLFEQKKTLTKADKEKIVEQLNKLNMNIGSNMDFIAEQFNKQLDKTLMEAKGEIEAFCQNKVNSIASVELIKHKDELLQLENPVDLNIE